MIIFTYRIIIQKSHIMTDYKLPKKLVANDPELNHSTWKLGGGPTPYYSLEIRGAGSRIIATVAHMNNRGITLFTFALTGEKLLFTLKPSQWNFIYGED